MHTITIYCGPQGSGKTRRAEQEAKDILKAVDAANEGVYEEMARTIKIVDAGTHRDALYNPEYLVDLEGASIPEVVIFEDMLFLEKDLEQLKIIATRKTFEYKKPNWERPFNLKYPAIIITTTTRPNVFGDARRLIIKSLYR